MAAGGPAGLVCLLRFSLVMCNSGGGGAAAGVSHKTRAKFSVTTFEVLKKKREKTSGLKSWAVVLFDGEERACLHCAVSRVAPSTHVAESPNPAVHHGGWPAAPCNSAKGAVNQITIIIFTDTLVVVVGLVRHFHPNHIPVCLGDRFHSNRV